MGPAKVGAALAVMEDASPAVADGHDRAVGADHGVDPVQRIHLACTVSTTLAFETPPPALVEVVDARPAMGLPACAVKARFVAITLPLGAGRGWRAGVADT